MGDIQSLVSYYTKKYNTNNPFKLADCLNIYFVIRPLGDVLGTYKYIDKAKWIFINNNIEDTNLQKVVMAHELGHAILHSKVNGCFMEHHTLLLTSKIEAEANTFASELLITDSMLQDFYGFTVEQFEMCTGIPKELIQLRLNDL